ncbi:MAG TPA: hypothetical protein VKB92_15420 [Myxococcales bacterium]|nr:hypothetical protein [Myxococcales bacterium]
MGNPILYQHGGIVIPIGQGVTVRLVRKRDQMSAQEHAKLIQDALVRLRYLSQADKEKEAGDIGPLTREALVDFEVDRDLSATQAALAEMKADAKAEAEKLIEELDLHEVLEKLLSEPPLVPVSDPPGEDQSDPAPL